MKKLFNKTTYSLLILTAFFSGIIWVNAINVPLNEAPYVKNGAGGLGNHVRGQYKVGPLTIGSATTNTSSLSVVGNLKVNEVDCTVAPYTGLSAIPCPYPSYIGGINGNNQRVAFRILGSGNGIGGYANELVVGAPINTPITSQTSLDIVGAIRSDPAVGYLNYAGGTLYPGSVADKPLCALDNGDIVVCGTVSSGSCGPLNGTTYSGAITLTTPGLCSSGAPTFGGFQTIGSYHWTCVGNGGGSVASCSVTTPGGVNGGVGGVGGVGGGTSGTGGGVQQGG